MLAYLSLTGSRPYEGQENPEVRRRNFARGPVPAHEEAAHNQRPPLPPSVSEVLGKAMNADPPARQPSLASFVEELERALSGSSVVVRASPSVFFSYKRAGGAGWAVHFAEKLKQQHGIDVFVDMQRVDSAQPFPQRIDRASKNADVFVCLLGSDTLSSDWVQREIRAAYSRHKPMLPVFEESYEKPQPGAPLDPAVQMLLDHDGVFLFDQMGVHIDHTISDLANMIRATWNHLHK